ncbi:hypothetical protein ACLMMR_39885, partial [Streptomyces sp. NPDC000405]
MAAIPDKTHREDSSATLSGASLAAGALMTLSGSLSILMGVSGVVETDRARVQDPDSVGVVVSGPAEAELSV